MFKQSKLRVWRKRAGLLLVLIAGLSPVKAWDFKKPDQLGIGLTGGAALLMQGYGNVLIVEGSPRGTPLSWPGYFGGGYARLPLLPQLTLTLTGMVKIIEYSGVANPYDPLQIQENMHTLLAPMTLNVLITPYLKWKIKPYLLVGAGSCYYMVNRGFKFDPVIFTQYDGTATYGTLGGGFLIPVKDKFMIDLCIDYSYANTGHDLFPAPPTDDWNLINGDLCFRFGMDYIFRLTTGLLDSDHDGVPDELDQCPQEKEDPDGVLDHDGCPDYDHDGDGIRNEKDRCPNEAEDLDGFDDLDGCPDPDNDGDGVPDVEDYCEDTPLGTEVDERGCPVTTLEPSSPLPPSGPSFTDADADGITDRDDKCPTLKEDLDGFEDTDGCPDLDNDQDGNKDDTDKCPNQAEDVDGFEDSDGCPEVDNDQDGINDTDDKCPGTSATLAQGQDTKETRNDYNDDDGCPDEKPAEIKRGKMVLKGVTFEKNSIKLTDASYATLQQVYESLKAYPEVKVEIRGYTDNQGSREHNRELSQGRAESVLQYLVNKGISPDRLKAKGYGPADPVTSNETASGRAQNRRIEFHRTD